MKTTNNKRCRILLITIKNCESCNIMEDLITDVIEENNLNITFEIKSKSNISRLFLKTMNVTDFPCTIFYNGNDDIVYKIIGIKPKVLIYNIIRNKL